MSRHYILVWPIAVMTLFLLGCASESVIQTGRDENGVPQWVKQGSNIVKTGSGRIFLGVGSAPLLGDLSLQASTANNRARSEVGRVLSSYMEIVSRDYLASGQAAQNNFNEQTVARQIDEIDAMDLKQARIVDHWRDEKNNVIYAVAEIDMKGAKTSLKEADSIHKDLQRYLNEEGNDIFDRIAKDETPKVGPEDY